ncbi:hypothetical protein VTL71DRAFT_8955 [Oculimacula yallundae]|uniref:Heterokaryon incompatibility domain-containing protein n=1 Tax=Oculimacula yallundae TaxID=86028 RepID=A0ABR4BTG3_9HELO
MVSKVSMADSATNDEPATPAYDNFFSPRNKEFYAHSPYKAFNTHQQEIRLLKPLPLTEDKVLSFILIENCALDEVRNNYVTLSYCAGSPLVTEVVLVNGMKFNAFGNLHHALWEVIWNWEQKGKQLCDLLLWADQICIDQSNGAERSHQVSQMRDIYASSERVLIVLATKMSAQIPNSGMTWMAQVLKELLDTGLVFMDGPFRASYYTTGFRDWLREQVVDANFANGFQDFLELLRSPWWTRSWVYQEFIVSPAAEYLYKGASLDWKRFGAVLLYLLNDHSGIYNASHYRLTSYAEADSLDLGGPEFQIFLQQNYSYDQVWLPKRAFVMVRMKADWAERTDRIALRPWLECGQLCEASDPRDKAYAFLGLAYQSYNIVPDYSPSNTSDKLLMELAEKIITLEGNLELLVFVNTEDHRDKSSMPSWVPNWFICRTENERGTIGLYDRLGTRHKSSLSKHSPYNNLYDFDPPVVCSGVLKAVGFKLDSFSGREPIARHNRYESTRGISVELSGKYSLQELATGFIWWFPGTTPVVVLKQVDDHWVVMCVSDLRFSERSDSDWAERINCLMMGIKVGKDVQSLHDIDFRPECIEIH